MSRRLAFFAVALGALLIGLPGAIIGYIYSVFSAGFDSGVEAAGDLAKFALKDAKDARK